MIGIIGAQGKVGTECVKLLEMYEKLPFKIGSRSVELKLTTNYKSEYVDITDPDSCKKFLNGCKCVINCTPIKKINALIAAAEITKTNIIDIHRSSSYSNNNILIYTNIGISPGLTEAIPAFCKKRFGDLKKIELMHIVNDKFSYEGAKEYLEYVFDVKVVPMTLIRNYNIVPCDKEKMSISINNDIYKKMFYTDDKVKKICKELNLEEAKFSTCFIEGQTHNVLQTIKKSFDNIENLAEKLVLSSIIDTQTNKIVDGFIVTVQTKTNKQFTVVVRSVSANKLTATSAIAASILSLHDKRFGVYEMHNIVGLADLFYVMQSVDNSLFVGITEGGIDVLELDDAGVIE